MYVRVYRSFKQSLRVKIVGRGSSGNRFPNAVQGRIRFRRCGVGCKRTRRIRKGEGDSQEQVSRWPIHGKMLQNKGLGAPHFWRDPQVDGRAPQDTPAAIHTHTSCGQPIHIRDACIQRPLEYLPNVFALLARQNLGALAPNVALRSASVPEHVLKFKTPPCVYLSVNESS